MANVVPLPTPEATPEERPFSSSISAGSTAS